MLVEHAGVDKAAASALASASGGSVSRALSEKSGDLNDDRDAALAILAALRKSVGDQLKASATFAKNESDRRDREALSARIDALSSLLRDVGAILSGSNDTLANADLERDLRALAPHLTAERVIAGYAALGRAQQALERNAGPKIVADWVALHL